jgi:hypothetical protein
VHINETNVMQHALERCGYGQSCTFAAVQSGYAVTLYRQPLQKKLWEAHQQFYLYPNSSKIQF